MEFFLGAGETTSSKGMDILSLWIIYVELAIGDSSAEILFPITEAGCLPSTWGSVTFPVTSPQTHPGI